MDEAHGFPDVAVAVVFGVEAFIIEKHEVTAIVAAIVVGPRRPVVAAFIIIMNGRRVV